MVQSLLILFTEGASRRAKEASLQQIFPGEDFSMHEHPKKSPYFWPQSAIPNIGVPSHLVFNVPVLDILFGLPEVEGTSVEFAPSELVLLLSGPDQSLS